MTYSTTPCLQQSRMVAAAGGLNIHLTKWWATQSTLPAHSMTTTILKVVVSGDDGLETSAFWLTYSDACSIVGDYHISYGYQS